MLKTRFDSEKALEAVLYVASKAPNPQLYWVGKILYFADRKHLEQYGRLITGDHYCAMEFGPVASCTYDMLKFARKDEGQRLPSGASPDKILTSLQVKPEGKYDKVTSLREPDLDFLSKSDIDCINASIEEFGKMSFGQLCDVSHDNVWMSVGRNAEIPLENIAINCKDGEKLVRYLQG